MDSGGKQRLAVDPGGAELYKNSSVEFSESTET
jgi:hypothetical protein